MIALLKDRAILLATCGRTRKSKLLQNVAVAM